MNKQINKTKYKKLVKFTLLLQMQLKYNLSLKIGDYTPLFDVEVLV